MLAKQQMVEQSGPLVVTAISEHCDTVSPTSCRRDTSSCSRGYRMPPASVSARAIHTPRLSRTCDDGS